MNTLFVSIMGVNEASELWELSNTIIRGLCKSGKIVATPIDDTWAIMREQPAEALKSIEDALKKESLYHIAFSSPDEPIINFIKDGMGMLSLEQPIEAIFVHHPGPLSTRAANSLRRVGISTVKRLVESTLNQLWPIRNLGNRALRHTFDALKQATDNPSQF